MDNLDSQLELLCSLLAATRKPTLRSNFCTTLCKSASFSLELALLLAVEYFSFDLVIPVPILLLHVYTVYLYVDGKMLQCSTWCAKLCIIYFFLLCRGKGSRSKECL